MYGFIGFTYFFLSVEMDEISPRVAIWRPLMKSTIAYILLTFFFYYVNIKYLNFKSRN